MKFDNENEVIAFIQEKVRPKTLNGLFDESLISYSNLKDLGWEDKLLGIRKVELEYQFIYDGRYIKEIYYCNLYSDSLRLYQNLSYNTKFELHTIKPDGVYFRRLSDSDVIKLVDRTKYQDVVQQIEQHRDILTSRLVQTADMVPFDPIKVIRLWLDIYHASNASLIK
jgi:hypothetical protein|nr:MAG TPA: hypothetical protein [Caudoviricetes sp.]